MPPIDSLLPELSDDEEAQLLGVNKAISAILDKLPADDTILADQTDIAPLEFYAILNWQRVKMSHCVMFSSQRRQNPQQWLNHYNN